MGLIDMRPRHDIASTGYALATPGLKYLVLEPDGRAFTIDLPACSYQVERFDVTTRETTASDVGPATLVQREVTESPRATHLTYEVVRDQPLRQPPTVA